MSKNYKTEGKSKLEGFLMSHPDEHFTVEQICLGINGDLSAKSSVYRNLSELCIRGSVRKFKSEGQTSFVYQYLGHEKSCHDHFHLKCIECGKLIHLECDMGNQLIEHITGHHGFFVDSGRSILYGVCAECTAGKKEKISF